MKRHSGFTTFTVTLLLIVILIGISLLVGKLMVADRKISVNEVQYRQALALAELGLADGLGRLAANAAWRGSMTVSSAQGTYLLSAVDSPSGSVTVGTPPNTKDVTPVVLRAEATLADGLGKAQVQVQVAGYSLMTDAKAAPLTSAGGAAIGGNYSVVANPNGGGPGVALSAWTDKPFDGGTGSWQTCHQGDSSNGSCNQGANLSDNTHLESDILASDPNFPPDLLFYLFGEPDTPAGWANMNDKAVAVPPSSSCASLGPTSTGIIIVQGNCTLPNVTGSTSAPVVLIVKDGSLKLNANNVFNGIIFAYSSTDPVTAPDIQLNGGATINGALISNAPLSHLTGTFNLNYDQNVISSIQNGASFQATKMVPGSWRDW